MAQWRPPPHDRSGSEAYAGKVARLAVDAKMPLDNGNAIGPLDIAYETWGTLNDQRSNAILICHALTGDQFCAGTHPVTNKPGWWPTMIGPGKPIDTTRYFVICSNVLGGCMGSTGPKSVDPGTGVPYGSHFPVITIADMVRAQKLLIHHLGIARLFAVVGGSMGGMNALQWAASYPDHVINAVIIASAARHTAQNIAFNEVGRQAILSDPGWANGEYLSRETMPRSGLAVARMAAHITYLSKAALQRKFGRNLQDRAAFTYGFEADFQVESYLRHQGNSFVERFDANSYLYITRAVDYFDLAADYDGNLGKAFPGTKVRFCIVAFSSDWLFPPEDSRDLVIALNSEGATVSFVEIETDKGHDAFLLDEPEFYRVVSGFLEGSAQQQGLFGPVVPQGKLNPIRPDLKLIADMIEPGTRVLDVGSGDGALLCHLTAERNVDGRGLELSREGVRLSVAKGLSVIHGDANRDLEFFGEGAFDYVVLSRTLQSVQKPRGVLEQLMRIGRRAIVSFDNFGFWRTRYKLMMTGRNPIYGENERWWHSDAIHPFTLNDFLDLAQSLDIRIEHCLTIDGAGKVSSETYPRPHANFMAREAVFLLSHPRG